MPQMALAVVASTVFGCGANHASGTEQSASECGDGRDNDGDGYVDCADQDCAALAMCADAGADSDADTDSDADVDSDSDSDSDSDADPCTGGDSWTIGTLDQTDDTGWNARIAVGPDGSAHVAYENSTRGFLRYATNESGAWVVETIDDGVPGGLVFDASGVLHAIYEGFEPGGSHLMHGWRELGGDWMFEEVDATPSGRQVAVFLDTDDVVHLAYWAADGFTNLRVANDATGSWAVEDLGAWGPGGLCLTSIAGVEYMGTIVAGNVRLRTWDGVTFTDDFVGLPRSSQCALLVDSGGVVQYVYAASPSDVVVAVDDGAGWNAETIGSNAYDFGAALLDESDVVHASYSRLAAGSFEAGDLVYVTNASGLWTDETVAAGPTDGSTILLDSLDRLHVAFRESTETAIDYAWRCR